jgi:hypothetical protein
MELELRQDFKSYKLQRRFAGSLLVITASFELTCVTAVELFKVVISKLAASVVCSSAVSKTASDTNWGLSDHGRLD